MPSFSISATLTLGLLLGLRHALDADHLAAVAAMLDERGGLGRAIRTGLLWGAGHSLSLGAVGGLLVVLRVSLPSAVALLFDLAVALMLVALGVAALVGALRPRLHVHEHAHGGSRHAHLHLHATPREAAHAGDAPQADDPPQIAVGAAIPLHSHDHPLRSGLRPFLVGSLHGLAGTGALVLLVLTTMPSVALGCLYLVLFGIGSIAGMALMSLVLGAPLLVARRRAARLYTLFRAAAGLGSLGLGLLMAWEIGAALLR